MISNSHFYFQKHSATLLVAMFSTSRVSTLPKDAWNYMCMTPKMWLNTVSYNLPECKYPAARCVNIQSTSSDLLLCTRCWAACKKQWQGSDMTSVRVEHVISTSSPWESIWSTRCHPMHSRGPSPGSIQHRPSHRPHSGAKASGTRQCLSPGRVVAVPGKKTGTYFMSWQLQFRCLCLDGWRTLSNAPISGTAHVC